MFSRGLGIVTALVNTVCSCHGCNYRSWEGTHVNHIISLSDWWSCQLVASEWCDDSVLGWLSIKGTLPWWNTAIMMCNEMEWITKCMKSSCCRVKVVLPCVELLVYWEAIEGTAMLISRENLRILSVTEPGGSSVGEEIVRKLRHCASSSCPRVLHWRQEQAESSSLSLSLVGGLTLIPPSRSASPNLWCLSYGPSVHGSPSIKPCHYTESYSKCPHPP